MLRSSLIGGTATLNNNMAYETQRHKIERVWIDAEGVYAATEDGLQAGYLFSRWPRLSDATEEQRSDFYLTYGGIHWPQIDEDLSFEGMFTEAGLGLRTATEDSFYWDSPQVVEEEL